MRGSRRMTVSKGNAEQPTAQAPRGQSSPTRVEVSAEVPQGAPQSPGTPRPQSPSSPGPRDQSGNNGPQDRTPTGAANNVPAAKVQGHEPASPNGQSKESRPQPAAGDPPVGTQRSSFEPAEAGGCAANAANAAEAGSGAAEAGAAPDTSAEAGRRTSHNRDPRPAVQLRARRLRRNLVLHLRGPRDSECTPGRRYTRLGPAPASRAQEVPLRAPGLGKEELTNQKSSRLLRLRSRRLLPAQ